MGIFNWEISSSTPNYTSTTHKLERRNEMLNRQEDMADLQIGRAKLERAQVDFNAKEQLAPFTLGKTYTSPTLANDRLELSDFVYNPAQDAINESLSSTFKNSI